MQSSSRLVGIDTLRGLLLIMMTVDHLLAWPFASWPKFFAHSYGPLGFFSAAEAFFFISGLIAGLLLLAKPELILGSLKTRLAKLYGANLLGLMCIALGIYFLPNFFAQWGESPWIKNFFAHPLEALFLSALFLYLPSFFDILPVYFIFFLSLPFIYGLFQKAQGPKLLTCSLVIWGFGQYAPWQRISAFLSDYIPLTQLGWFDIFSWQLLFLLGVMSGYFSQKLKSILETIPTYVTVVATAFCLICFACRHYFLLEDPRFAPWIDVRTLGPLRLANFLVAAYCISSIVRKATLFNVPSIAFLGRWSLPVFLYHSCLVYFLGAFTTEITALPLALKALVFSMAIASLWVPAIINHYKRMIKEYVYLLVMGPIKSVDPSVK